MHFYFNIASHGGVVLKAPLARWAGQHVFDPCASALYLTLLLEEQIAEAAEQTH